ncbi:sigma factor [Agrobacterium tumefaciens]|uniref:sigma factor n=1 Tax=Agrobacterium tumefaciens TaxID=358 RepID=UPI003B9F4EA7
MSVSNACERQLLHTLYCSHHGWLYAWLRGKLGDSFDAADLAHDTFLRLMNGRSVRDLGEEPRAFLTHIANGLVIDLWRRRAVQAAYAEIVAQLPEAQTPAPEVRLQSWKHSCRSIACCRRCPAARKRSFCYRSSMD